MVLERNDRIGRQDKIRQKAIEYEIRSTLLITVEAVN